MFLTRIGLESRCAITGDPSQIDLRRGIPSGLVESLQALRDVEDIAIVHLDETDVVRHPVVASIIQAYQRHRAKDDQPGAATNHHV